MIRELRLRNLAVAEDVRLQLGPGLNVLTGSTGAGKSLVVEALRWLGGEDVDRGLLRAGAEVASAEALVEIGDEGPEADVLDALGLPAPEDGILHLRREYRRGGRARAFIGDKLTSAAVLGALSRGLVRLQSQHQHLELLDPGSHAGLLDGLGVDPSIRRNYDAAWQAWRDAEKELHEERARLETLRHQRELLEYQARELGEAGLRAGELDELRHRVARFEGGGRLVEAAAEAAAALEDEQIGARAALARALTRLRGVPEELDELIEARERIVAALDGVDESLRDLQAFVEDSEFDPEETARAQDRLAFLLDLGRKYGRTESELIAWSQRLQEQLGTLDDEQSVLGKLEARRQSAVEALERAAAALEEERRRVGRSVRRRARPLLEELGMEGADLRFVQIPHSDPDGPLRVGGRRVRARADGVSAVRLEVRTNAGSAHGPVERVASGGELSRLGLVLRSLTPAGDALALWVLDEVDAGLGADLGPALARRLRALSDRQPLLVITHLATVAAAADRHLVVRKHADREQAVSTVETLDRPKQVVELARMIGGPSAQAHRLAEDLLAQSGPGRSAAA